MKPVPVPLAVAVPVSQPLALALAVPETVPETVAVAVVRVQSAVVAAGRRGVGHGGGGRRLGQV